MFSIYVVEVIQFYNLMVMYLSAEILKTKLMKLYIYIIPIYRREIKKFYYEIQVEIVTPKRCASW